MGVINLGWLGRMPQEQALSSIDLPLASAVYSSDGKLLGRYFLENRVAVRHEDISPFFLDALVATEDERFYKHDGLDEQSLARVLFKSILGGDERAGGGSTLTQQLVKNLYPRERYAIFSLLINKIQEFILAQRLEKLYSKKEILVMYSNTVPFGERVFGVEAAAQRFFSTPARALKADEAAVLVGMLKATTFYNPRRHPNRALLRRNVVLEQMVKNNYLLPAFRDSLRRLPLKLRYQLQTHHEGLAPFFREKLRLELVEWAKGQKKPDGSPLNIYTDGLVIQVSLDSRLQTYAEESLHSRMAILQQRFHRHWKGRRKPKAAQQLIEQQYTSSQRYRNAKAMGWSADSIRNYFDQEVSMRLFDKGRWVDTLLSPWDSLMHDIYRLQAGLVAIEPGTGLVKAWVGGVNHAKAQYDHVTSRRQTGSVFKPLVFVSALENGASPCEYYSNERVKYPGYETWLPANSDGLYGGAYSMAGALTHSVNLVSVAILMETGVKKVVHTAQALGLQGDLPAVPSLALGVGEASLLEMTNAYGIFSSQGTYRAPHYLLSIKDREGNIILDNRVIHPGVQAVPTEAADMIRMMMEEVIQKGTGRALRTRYALPYPIAGKTGTTQDQTDGWFVATTPGLSVGAWVGADDQRIKFRSLREGQGAATALPIWGSFMQKVYKDPAYRELRKARFPSPSDSVKKAMECEDYDFPLNPAEFRIWFYEQEGEFEKADSLRRVYYPQAPGIQN